MEQLREGLNIFLMQHEALMGGVQFASKKKGKGKNRQRHPESNPGEEFFLSMCIYVYETKPQR